MSARIGVSPLTGRIFRGRVNKAGDAFIGDKQDVTSDVMRAVIEKAEFHGGTFEIEGGTDRWTVVVTKQGAALAGLQAGGDAAQTQDTVSETPHLSMSMFANRADYDAALGVSPAGTACSVASLPEPQGVSALRVPPADAHDLLPHGYLLAKVGMALPLLQEARDALTALTEAQRVRYGISKTLADRMDVAGTYCLDDWLSREGSNPTGRVSAGPRAKPDEPGDRQVTRHDQSARTIAPQGEAPKEQQ